MPSLLSSATRSRSGSRLDAGRITKIGGDSGDAVTAGIYLFSERARRLPAPPTIGRLREYLAWLVEQGETIRGISIQTVVDVDRSEDIRIAEALARGQAPAPAKL